MNLSNIFRAASGFFFCFYFVFGSNTAQAINIQKALGFYASLSQKAKKAKEKEVFGILENLDIKPKIEPKNLTEEELRVLVHALDDPTNLIRSALGRSLRKMDDSLIDPTDLIRNPPYGVFESDLHRAFFFSRFHLHRDSDGLFIKLFSFIDDDGFDLEDILLLDELPFKELPFEEAKMNWENFLDAAKRAKQTGRLSNLDTIDLEAAAMSFIHQRLSDFYYQLRQEDFYIGLTNPNSWTEDSLGKFFHNRFSIDHYMSPHFTLTPENHYSQYIMSMITEGFFLFRGQNHPLINSKEFILKIWKNSMEEIKLSMFSSSTFLGRIVVESIIECRREGLSPESHNSLKAMAEAAREDDRLAEFMGIVYNLVSSTNLENYYWSLQNFTKVPESATDWLIFDFLSRSDLKDFVLQHSGPTDPANAPNTAEAMNMQEVSIFYISLSQNAQKAKKKEVFGILENLDDIKPKIDPNNLTEQELRVLVYALDEPTNLIQNSPYGVFESDLHRAFFFSRFDLHRDSDGLFTKLFSSTDDQGVSFQDILLLDELPLKELPFEEAKMNWENFLDAAKRAKQTGRLSNLDTIDLEAAAMSFIHQKFLDEYYLLRQEDSDISLINPNSWPEQSLGNFFHNRFSIDHYMSPHFTLTPENHYFQYIIAMIEDGFFLFRGQNHPLINSKEFILKIWKDSIEEFNGLWLYGSSTFLGRILVESIIECRRQGISLESHSFLKHMAEAAREDDHLDQLFNIVRNLVSRRNLEVYYWSLQDFIRMPELVTDRMISNFLSRPDLKDFVLQHPGPTDPADGGTLL